MVAVVMDKMHNKVYAKFLRHQKFEITIQQLLAMEIRIHTKMRWQRMEEYFPYHFDELC